MPYGRLAIPGSNRLSSLFMTSGKNPPIRDFLASHQSGADAPDDALTGHDGAASAPGGLALPLTKVLPYPARHPVDLILPARARPDDAGAAAAVRAAVWQQTLSVRTQIELIRCFAEALRERSGELAARGRALQARSALLQRRVQALPGQRAGTRRQDRGMTGASPAPQATPPPAPGAAPASAPEATAVSSAQPLAPPATPVTAVPAPATAVALVRQARIIPFSYVSADPDATEVPLIGGDMTEGVVRVGRTVRRPVRSHTPAVHALLRYLEAVGFEGAPRALGVDARNREVLTYLPGVVARRPLPGFVAADSTLASLAELQFRYHRAVAGFAAPDWAQWDGEVTRFVDGPPEIICHCDVNLENVIFRAGPHGLQPYAFIDFDLARPGTRLVDIIQTLRYWAPIADPADRNPALRDADAAGRIALFCEAYGLSYTERARLVPVASRWLRRSRATIAQRARMSGGAWTRMLDAGVHDRLLRSAIWLERNRPEIEARLRRPGRRPPSAVNAGPVAAADAGPRDPAATRPG